MYSGLGGGWRCFLVSGELLQIDSQYTSIVDVGPGLALARGHNSYGRRKLHAKARAGDGNERAINRIEIRNHVLIHPFGGEIPVIS